MSTNNTSPKNHSNQEPQPVPHSDETALSDLARTIAEELNEPTRLSDFEVLCRRLDHDRIRDALDRVRRTPESRIRKSRLALFYYLLKQDTHEKK
jgi:hypothetical protein